MFEILKASFSFDAHKNWLENLLLSNRCQTVERLMNFLALNYVFIRLLTV